MRVLGVIPARGGSKGVLRKNLRFVAGRPLIEYSIQGALGSVLLDRFVVSTDDDEIAEVASRAGAEVLRRPKKLAEDDTPMVPVIFHAQETIGAEWDAVVVLQPTTPLRTAGDIDKALEILESTAVDSVVSVYRVEDEHPARMYRIENGLLVPYSQEPSDRLRQSLPTVYHRNGAVYATKISLLKDQNTLVGGRIAPYVMPRSRSVNIDDETDLMFADFLIARLKEGKAL